jgi:bifunctional UDP-N-acetylglucosamine pyrophosphorylase/glucosamine-1-phosphate N-acetyltransferase
MPAVASPTVVILAAGQGTRMRSRTPKVLHPICGRPLGLWPVEAARDAGAERIVVVCGPDRALEPVLPEGVAVAVQEEARGTGDAVRAAAEHFDPGAPVIVLAGDVPLITPELIANLAEAHASSPAAATIVTMELEDPSGYGRVVRDRDGNVERVVETKAPGDATPEELAIREVNTGIFAFDGDRLGDALQRIGADNAQGEYYLPDALPILRSDGATIAAFALEDPDEALGVNDRVDLETVRRLAQRRIAARHMRAGVTIVAPETSVIDVGVEIGQDTVIEPGCVLVGDTRIGAGATVGPHTTLIGARLGDEVSVVHSHLVDCDVEDGATIGPFAYLRPGTRLRRGAKAGTFVEIKNSDIGEGTKVPHLSYVGDADIGPRSNLGASTITANYDGVNKHRTTIGSDFHGGVDTAFVAPVTVGDHAWTAAGSVVTGNVPDGALAVARARQRNIERYDERKQRSRKES